VIVEGFGGCLPPEGFAWSAVECVGYRFEIFGTVSVEIRGLGEVLTDSSWCFSSCRTVRRRAGHRSRWLDRCRSAAGRVVPSRCPGPR